MSDDPVALEERVDDIWDLPARDEALLDPAYWHAVVALGRDLAAALRQAGETSRAERLDEQVAGYAAFADELETRH